MALASRRIAGGQLEHDLRGDTDCRLVAQRVQDQNESAAELGGCQAVQQDGEMFDGRVDPAGTHLEDAEVIIDQRIVGRQLAPAADGAQTERVDAEPIGHLRRAFRQRRVVGDHRRAQVVLRRRLTLLPGQGEVAQQPIGIDIDAVRRRLDGHGRDRAAGNGCGED